MAPAGADKLFVTLAHVQIEGGYPEFAEQSRVIAAGVEGRRISVADIYSAAAQVEALYAGAGYVLVRVAVPPQQLAKGGTLKLAVVDGFIEAVETRDVPERLRATVVSRVADLVNKPRLRLAELERRVLLAGDVAGIKLRSTIARGEKEGGTRLILAGTYARVSISAGGDNRLPTSLGTSQARMSASLNSLLGFGEQVYVSAGTSMDGDGFHADDPLRFAGIGAVIPLGSDGFTLNPEYTKSATRPSVSIGAPRVSGAFERLALRTAYPLIRAHDHTLTMTGGLSFIRQSQRARDFSVDLDKDQYSVASVGIEDSYTFSSGTLLTSGLTLSHGLGGRGQPEALFSGVPLSRQGAGPVFTKLTGAVHLSQPLPQEFWLDIVALGQSSFGKPLLSPEQFALDGSNAVSAFAAGSFSVDQGATLRAEIRRPFVVSRFGIAPYVFAAAGRGEIVEPTAVEQSIVAAQSVGLGVRTQVDPLRTGAGEEAITLPGFSIGFEAGRQFSNLPGLQHGWRAGLDVSAKF